MNNLDNIDNDKVVEMKNILKEASREKARLNSKQYYEKNKEVIMAKMCKPVQCNLCGRVVIANNLKNHQQKNICLKIQTLIK
jgi:formylmethanofuran dehydrogenase subunit E